MRVTLTRSGGFAGARLVTTIDCEELESHVADKLRKLIDAADFFNLPKKITAAGAPQPDRFQYEFAIEENGRSHTVVVSEQAAPPALLALAKWISKIKRSK